MVDDVVVGMAGGLAEQRLEHPGLGPGQAARAAGAHDAGQAQHPLGRGNRHALGDHAAHAHADDMRALNLQRVKHAHSVGPTTSGAEWRTEGLFAVLGPFQSRKGGEFTWPMAVTVIAFLAFIVAVIMVLHG